MRELHFWLLPNNGYETLPTIREHLSGYQREHPGDTVVARARTKSVIWDEVFRILKDKRYGRKPDIIQIPAHWTSTLAHLGILHDLRELDPSIDLRGWVKPAQDNCRLIGTAQIYSLPWWMSLKVLYYRKDALAKIGVDAAADLSTWEGLRDVCRALRVHWRAGSGRHPMANPNPRETVSLMDLAPAVWSHGGELFSADGSRALFQRENAARGIASYFGLLHEGSMPLVGPNGLPPGNLFSGDCALQFSGRFPRPEGSRALPAKLFRKLGARPFPTGGQPGVSALTVYNLAVLKDCENPRRAYRLLRELVRDSAAAAYARAIGAFPATEGGLSRSLEDNSEFHGVFTQALETARSLPNLRVLGTIEKIFDRNMDRLVRSVMSRRYGPKTLRQELIHASAEIDYVLSVYESNG